MKGKMEEQHGNTGDSEVKKDRGIEDINASLS